jgi:hypothetical protein
MEEMKTVEQWLINPEQRPFAVVKPVPHPITSPSTKVLDVPNAVPQDRTLPVGETLELKANENPTLQPSISPVSLFEPP